jgi:hypothetical protein
MWQTRGIPGAPLDIAHGRVTSILKSIRFGGRNEVMRALKVALPLLLGASLAGCAADYGGSYAYDSYGSTPGYAYAPSYGYAPSYSYAPSYGYRYAPPPSYSLNFGYYDNGYRDNGRRYRHGRWNRYDD